MRDLYLEAMLHGEIVAKRSTPLKKATKNRFELAIDENIERILSYFSFDESLPERLQLNAPQMKRRKLQLEMTEMFTLTDKAEFIEIAIPALIDDGQQYLESASYSSMVANFQTALARLDQLELETAPVDDLNAILRLQTETIESIFKVAIATFEQDQYAISLALFMLLTVLQPADYDYWYRAGIVAQLCQNYNLAIESYQQAAFYHPTNIYGQLFIAECHLALNQKQDARLAYEEAKKIAETISLEENALKILHFIGSKLSA